MEYKNNRIIDSNSNIVRKIDLPLSNRIGAFQKIDE
jgi:hypothetical protein